MLVLTGGAVGVMWLADRVAGHNEWDRGPSGEAPTRELAVDARPVPLLGPAPFDGLRAEAVREPMMAPRECSRRMAGR
jgi:hypothetical protein